MQLQDLSTFLTVAAERSFSSAAKKLHRTQPAVSQGIRRLEEELGERLFDRTSRTGTLTEAGRLLQDYAMRLMRLAADAEQAVRELQQVRRGRVVIGANEAAVHTLLPFIERFARDHPQALVEVRRVPSRQMAAEILNRSLDFGVLTFQPPDKGAAVDLARPRRARAADPPDASARRRDAASRSRRSAARRSSRTTTRRRRASACCGCTSGATRRSTSRLRCPASTASSARWSRGSASRCCRAAARWRRSRAVSSPRSTCRGSGRRARSGWCSAAAASCRTPPRRSSRRSRPAA